LLSHWLFSKFGVHNIPGLFIDLPRKGCLHSLSQPLPDRCYGTACFHVEL
jgi:hypothetical protein